jgi:ferredoxin
MKVWIDQDLCTGDGLCAEIAPAVFEMHNDGLAYVKEVDWPNLMGPTGKDEDFENFGQFGDDGQDFDESIEEIARPSGADGDSKGN